MEPEARTSARRAADLLVCGLFAAVLLAPLVDQFVRPGSDRNVVAEFRTPAKRPAFPASYESWKGFPSRFGHWFEDHFGLRDRFLALNSLIKWFGLHTSPTGMIVQGEGDWIFVTERKALENHRGAMPMSPALLDAWRRMLEARRDWLADLGVEYVFAVSPSKVEVYPERLPERYAPLGPPRLEQLLEYLAEHSDLRVLDLRPATRASKARDEQGDYSYYPLGNHWTDRTAYAAYVSMIRRLGKTYPELAPLGPQEFEVREVEEQGDSWAGRMYLEGFLLQDNYQWSLRRPRARKVDGRLGGRFFSAERRDGKGPRALLYHDSFSLPMRPWLAEHFARFDAIWAGQIDVERIERERPDFVIQAYNEFTLLRTTPFSLPAEDHGRTAERFESSARSIWRMDPEHPAWHMRTNRGRPLAKEGERLVISSLSADELVELPLFEFPPGASIVLRIELESEVATLASLLYRTELNPTLESTQQVSVPVEAGRSIVYLELPAEPFVGRLALLFDKTAARYEIIDLEIRAL